MISGLPINLLIKFSFESNDQAREFFGQLVPWLLFGIIIFWLLTCGNPSILLRFSRRLNLIKALIKGYWHRPSPYHCVNSSTQRNLKYKNQIISGISLPSTISALLSGIGRNVGHTLEVPLRKIGGFLKLQGHKLQTRGNKLGIKGRRLGKRLNQSCCHRGSRLANKLQHWGNLLEKGGRFLYHSGLKLWKNRKLISTVFAQAFQQAGKTFLLQPLFMMIADSGQLLEKYSSRLKLKIQNHLIDRHFSFSEQHIQPGSLIVSSDQLVFNPCCGPDSSHNQFAVIFKQKLPFVISRSNSKFYPEIWQKLINDFSLKKNNPLLLFLTAGHQRLVIIDQFKTGNPLNSKFHLLNRPPIEPDSKIELTNFNPDSAVFDLKSESLYWISQNLLYYIDCKNSKIKILRKIPPRQLLRGVDSKTGTFFTTKESGKYPLFKGLNWQNNLPKLWKHYRFPKAYHLFYPSGRISPSFINSDLPWLQHHSLLNAGIISGKKLYFLFSDIFPDQKEIHQLIILEKKS